MHAICSLGMMFHKALWVSIALITFLPLSAANGLSAFSKVLLSRQSSNYSHDKAAPSHENKSYQAFISTSDQQTIDLLKSHGVKIDGRFGNYVTARIPASQLNAVVKTRGVLHVSLAQPLHLCNDSARYYSAVDPLHLGKGIVAPIQGDGVIVGVIDSGIDFNHINLCDATGHTRVRAVYLPVDSLGTAPVVQGDTLPGSCYETPWEIEALTTDYTFSNHGTHTTGTAAGSYLDNGWYGVAPKADIVACGLPAEALTDVNVANAVKYIFDYAERAGKPCVINLSIGTNVGPNDGSSFLCQTFSSLSGPGRICVVSAGNDGNAPVCFRYFLNGRGDTVTTLLRNQSGGLQRSGYVSMWSDHDQIHQSRVVVVNRNSGNVEYSSPLIGLLPGDSVYYLSSEVDEALATFYSGEILCANALEPQIDGSNTARYHSIWEFDATAVSDEYLLGLQYVADDETSLVGWCTNNTYFYSYDLPGVVGGSSAGSISDLATTDGVISVGAYSTRNTYYSNSGDLVTFKGFKVGDMAKFSSYGPDERGVARPDICAPGAIVLSSANRYDVNSNRQRWPSPVVMEQDTFPYYANQGTSMSAPVVTGTIALMLQVNPALTTAMVRDVLRRSANRDEYVINGQSDRWGFGKLDSWAAIDDVMTNTLTSGDVNNDSEINIADVVAIINIILGKEPDHIAQLLRADVNRDSEIVISDVNCVINMILK